LHTHHGCAAIDEREMEESVGNGGRSLVRPDPYSNARRYSQTRMHCACERRTVTTRVCHSLRPCSLGQQNPLDSNPNGLLVSSPNRFNSRLSLLLSADASAISSLCRTPEKHLTTSGCCRSCIRLGRNKAWLSVFLGMSNDDQPLDQVCESDRSTPGLHSSTRFHMSSTVTWHKSLDITLRNTQKPKSSKNCWTPLLACSSIAKLCSNGGHLHQEVFLSIRILPLFVWFPFPSRIQNDSNC
jgi:hypothetical protein